MKKTPKQHSTSFSNMPTAGALHTLEISESNKGGFGMTIDGKEMLLPRGQPFWTPSHTYAQHTLEILKNGGPEHLDKNRALICPDHTLFLDFTSGIVAPSSKSISTFKRTPGYWAALDPIHALCAGPEVVEQLAALSPFQSFCRDRGILPPSWPQGRLTLPDKPTDFHEVVRANSYESEIPANLRYFETLEREFRQLAPPQIAVMHTHLGAGCFYGGAPFVLTLLLVKGLCSAEDFAKGFLATLCIIPRVFADVSHAQYKRELAPLQRDAERALFFLKHH